MKVVRFVSDRADARSGRWLVLEVVNDVMFAAVPLLAIRPAEGVTATVRNVGFWPGVVLFLVQFLDFLALMEMPQGTGKKNGVSPFVRILALYAMFTSILLLLGTSRVLLESPAGIKAFTVGWIGLGFVGLGSAQIPEGAVNDTYSKLRGATCTLMMCGCFALAAISAIAVDSCGASIQIIGLTPARLLQISGSLLILAAALCNGLARRYRAGSDSGAARAAGSRKKSRSTNKSRGRRSAAAEEDDEEDAESEDAEMEDPADEDDLDEVEHRDEFEYYSDDDDSSDGHGQDRNRRSNAEGGRDLEFESEDDDEDEEEPKRRSRR